MPAAATVALGTFGVILALFPRDRWRSSAYDAIAAVTYTENFRLQALNADYFADSTTVSAFQHYWSLSIQGQIFIIWAVLHLAAHLAARVTRILVREILLIGFTLLFTVSLIQSIRHTALDQQQAYFDTFLRMWEFAAGSLAALVHPWLAPSAKTRTVMGWLGLIGILTCGWLLPVANSFPGYAAMWPVISTILVIFSSGSPTRFGADRLLRIQPLERAGKYSYALYLTHWPVLILYLVLSGSLKASFLEGLIILLFSVLVSIAVVNVVERPTEAWLDRQSRNILRGLKELPSAKLGAKARSDSRRWAGLRGAPIVAVSITAVALPALLSIETLDRQNDAFRTWYEQTDVSTRGANWQGRDAAPLPVLPGDPKVVTDYPRMEMCPSREREMCLRIPSSGSGEPEKRVLLVGNSHAQVSLGMFAEAVERRPEWELDLRVVSNCTIEQGSEIHSECAELWPDTIETIAAEQPDLVAVWGTQARTSVENIQHGFIPWLEEARAVSPDTALIVIRDVPFFSSAPLKCAIQHGPSSPECRQTNPLSKASDEAALSDFREQVEEVGATWVDLNGDICPGGVCSPTVGGIFTYYDTNHLTDIFARSLAQRFADEIRNDVPWWPEEVYLGDKVAR